MQIDKYINMSREEFIKFLNLDHLIPIDNVIEYKGKKYKLSEEKFYSSIAYSRINLGYDINYSEKLDIETAQQINMGTLGEITIIKDKIENDLKLGKVVRYENG